MSLFTKEEVIALFEMAVTIDLDYGRFLTVEEKALLLKFYNMCESDLKGYLNKNYQAIVDKL